MTTLALPNEPILREVSLEACTPDNWKDKNYPFEKDSKEKRLSVFVGRKLDES